MTSSSKSPNLEQINREKRRSEQLRANLARRKQQLRSRRAGSADERDEGIVAAAEKPSDSSQEES
ncbi:hypothetical protein CU102_02675 [Phyllobacterium brassicacearum]|uniref:Uncharacterized protein n=1 Tax=Phyllobacterium brassicacearum TaxID=314235 RepID=A0A2P7BWY8_9HYPH|nr:hypothetical protein [Phyllobacterium brassicacearum]PSH70968.1 hypothetical protein CU102_02675 [Phyllobacterium brassicacearum]TDQ35530.1 hypothetical protein DEV91_10111 [Phyllobacterium brassicacearum]